MNWYVDITTSPRLPDHEFLRPSDVGKFVEIRGAVDQYEAQEAATAALGNDWAGITDHPTGDVIGVVDARKFVRKAPDAT